MFCKKGFTLLELIIYIAILSIIMVVVISFTWRIMKNTQSVENASEVVQTMRLVFNKFNQTIRQADEIVIESSTLNSNPGVLVVTDGVSGDQIIFDTYLKTIQKGGNDLEIRTLRVTSGSNPAIDLTSEKVKVTNLVFRNLVREKEPANINLQLTLENVHPGEGQTLNKSLSLETAASIRKK